MLDIAIASSVDDAVKRTNLDIRDLPTVSKAVNLLLSSCNLE
jgi:hypothetical protein